MHPYSRQLRSVFSVLFHGLFVLVFLTGLLVTQPLDDSFAAPLDDAPERPALLPTASVTLNVPASVPIGDSFTFTATFDNTDADEVGYGPFIDLVFPVIGVDGAGAAIDDGIDFVSATYLGAPVIAVQQTFGAADTGGCSGGLGPVNHPYAVALTTGTPLLVCGTPEYKLVTLLLPFGSFSPLQPTGNELTDGIAITINATLSNLADASAPLTIRARGGYQYGATPTNDWCCGDASIVSHSGTSTSWPGSPVTPTVLSLTKSYNGPEDETATGPNYPRQYTLTVDIATGQSVDNLIITDNLPNNMQFVSVDSATPAATCTLPSTSTPDGTLSCDFGTVADTAPPTAADATLIFNFYIPLNNASSNPVINATSGDDATSLNTSTVTGSWDPFDGRDPITPVSAGGVCPTGCHTLADKSIAIQKSVANVGDIGYIGNSPGDTLEYTLTFQVSDFFSFMADDPTSPLIYEGLLVTDKISDGQHFDPTFTPTLSVNGNAYGISGLFGASNYDIDTSMIGNDPNPATDGSTTLRFRVSDEIEDQGADGRLIGGCVPVAGTGGPVPDCTSYDDGSTTGTIVFRTIIQQDFTDTYPSGDTSVDHGDILENDVTVVGNLLSVMNNSTPTGEAEADDSGAELSIAFGTLSKSVYAVNGVVCSPCTTEISTIGLNPFDTVTFRLRYFQPSSDFEQTTLTDYLPLPIFDATTVTSFSNAVCGVPGSGNACLGPADTYHALNGPPTNEPNPVVTPVMSTDAANNFVRFSYADYDSSTNTSSEIDLLFTATVSNQPFADGLFLTNQANGAEGTTNAGDQALDTILQVKINEPVLIPKKSAVSTDSTAPTVQFNPAIGAPIAFDIPGGVDGTPDWSGGVISSNYLAANPIDADLTGIDAGDRVKFAIVIENQGHSIDGAFDITILDSKPPEYIYPGNDVNNLNFEVFLGDGTPVAFTRPDNSAATGADLFTTGIRLVDPGVPPSGACQAHNATSGQNVIIITYDLELSGLVSLSQNIINTSTLVSYSGTEGGPNYVPSGVTDTATITPIATPVKSLVITSEAHTVESGSGDVLPAPDPRRVAIGEVVRYRLTVGIAEGMVPNFRLRDNLPTGLEFINDGTAMVALVSTGGNLTSSTLIDPDLVNPPDLSVVGDETTVAGIVPDFPLPDEAVSSTDSTSVANYAANNTDTYISGTDVYFKLGDLTNPDRDNDNGEFVVIEFNGVVANIVGNGTGSDIDNTSIYRTDGSSNDSAASNTIRVRTVQPSITMAKSILSSPTPPDAGGQVTYRITVANGTGADITTAFDLVVTDTLPNALTLNALPGSVVVTPSGTVGAITDFSAVNSPPGTPSQLDVRIASLGTGSSVTIDYTATINGSVTPNQIIANTGLTTWTSLPGDSGTTSNPTGSSTPGNSGDANGERNGSGASPNTYRLTSSQSFNSQPVGITKQLTATSASHTSGTDVAIGEEITYSVLLTFPEGSTASDTVMDDLVSGLALVSGTPEVITSAALSGGLLTADFGGTIGTQSITETLGNGGAVQFDFTNVSVTADNDTTNNTILLRFRAQGTNIAGNQAGTTISNSATSTAGTVVATSNSVSVRVVEPLITFGKSIINLPTPLDAGSVVDYRISYVNGTGATVSTAMDVVITDTFPAQLILNLPVTITLGGGAAGITDSSNAAGVNVSIASIPPGGSVIIDYSATVTSSVTPGQIITNTSDSNWTSLSGSVTGERTGTGGVDDYFANSSRNFTADAITITKLIAATSATHTSGTDVAIGEEVTYSILLTFPEGTTPSDIVVDDLVGGLALVSGTPEVITSAALSGGLLTADFNGTIGTQTITPTLGDGGAVQFDFTNVSVTADNITTNNTILLRFRAQGTNIAGNQAGTTISNSATSTAGTVVATSNSVSVRVVEPLITFGKTIVLPLPSPLDAGGVVNYRISYVNGTGATVSTAMDIVITDTFPAQLILNLPVTITLGGGAAGITDSSNAAGVNVTIASVPPGGSVTIDYSATIQSSVTPGQIITNTSDSNWTSLSGPVTGERTGNDGPGGALDDYAATSSQNFTIDSSNVIEKRLMATSASHTPASSVAIGEVVTYGILLTFPEGTTAADTVVDDLPTGLAVVGTPQVITSAASSGGLLSVDFNGTLGTQIITVVSGDGGSVQFDFTNVVVTGDNNLANNTILLSFDARVSNIIDNQSGDTLSNTASNSVNSGAPVNSNSIDVLVVEPVVQITKTVDDLYPVTGEVVKFTLFIEHDPSSSADALDVKILDLLPPDLDLDLGPPTSVVIIPSAGVTGTITDLSSGNQVEIDIDSLPLNESVVVTFEATYIGPSSPLTNTAGVTWTSLPGSDTNERTGVDGPGGLNNYTASAQVGLSNVRTLQKSLDLTSNLTSNETLPDVTIGDIITYQVQLTVPGNSSDTYIVVDTLDAGLAFVACLEISGPAGLTSPAITDFTAGAANCNEGTGAGSIPLIASDGHTVTFDFGSLTNSTSTTQTVTIRYTAAVLDDTVNSNGGGIGSATQLNNEVVMTWITPAGGGDSLTASAQQVTVNEPLLEFGKTVDPMVATPGSTIMYTLHVNHAPASTGDAFDLVITDEIPAEVELTFVGGNPVVNTVTGQVPNSITYDVPTRILRISWDEFDATAIADLELDIPVQISSSVGRGTQIVNSATLEWSSLPGDFFSVPQSNFNTRSTERRYDPLAANPADIYGITSSAIVTIPRLPRTGFAPGEVTLLPPQPSDMQYADLGDFWLEIPDLGVKIPIVGVPFNDQGWDLTWLGDQAGYLDGTAYPTHAGNSGITAHAYLPNGEPGPFVNLNKLSYGDQIVVHLGGQLYYFEVRENRRVGPDNLSALKHEEYPWLTLISCQDYSETLSDYKYRIVVRAVLIKIESEDSR